MIQLNINVHRTRRKEFVLLFYLLGSSFRFDVDDTMDSILDMNKNLSSVCFRLFPTDVAWDNFFFFCLCHVIALAYCFGEMVPVTAIMDEISL